MRGPDRRPAGLFPLVLLGVWPFGCTLDFTEPLQQEAVSLRLTVIMDQGTQPLLEVQGQFHPGRDERGVFRTVEDPTVGVAGAAIAPVGVNSDGQLRYHATLPATPESLRFPVEVHGPQVAGVSLPRPMFRFGFCSRSGADVVSVDSDGYLRLGPDCIRPPEMGGAVPVRWSLSLASPDGTFVLTLERSGEEVPSTLELPGAWFTGVAADELEASLSVFDEAEWEDETGRYRMALRIISILRWRVPLGA